MYISMNKKYFRNNVLWAINYALVSIIRIVNIVNLRKIFQQEGKVKYISILNLIVNRVEISCIFYFQQEGNPKDADSCKPRNVYLETIHWKKGGLVGTGAFSSCFEAMDFKSGRIMAVKQVGQVNSLCPLCTKRFSQSFFLFRTQDIKRSMSHILTTGI